jgi:uroporphyrinogen decarboxylase
MRLAAAGIDMLSNLDPLAPGADLVTVKQELGAKVALCGGINNTFILEAGTPEQVREEVARAAALLGAGGGYIMAPSDGPGYIVTTDTVRRNCEVMVEAWRGIR